MRDQVETGAIKFQWVSTNNMAADDLTKALSNEKFTQFVYQLGLKQSNI